MNTSSCSIRSRWLRIPLPVAPAAPSFERDTFRNCRCKPRFSCSRFRLSGSRSHRGNSGRAKSEQTQTDNSPDTLPASCVIRDRDGSWARRAAEDSVSATAVSRAQFASASRRRIPLFAAASLPGENLIRQEPRRPVPRWRNHRACEIHVRCGDSARLRRRTRRKCDQARPFGP